MSAPARPEVVGDLGAVSSTHWIATAIGMSMLERGGNAFDAAVAAGLALQVLEPQSNGLGGDASIVLYDARTARSVVICGQGTMPAAADLATFRGLGLRQIPGSGLLGATVPGSVGAWLRLLAEFGTMSLAEVFTPAIALAEDGYPLPNDAQRAIAALVPLFRDEWISSGHVFLHRGGAPRPGARMRNPELAATMRRLVAEGRSVGGNREAQIEAADRAFYAGFVAEALDRFLRSTEVIDSTGRRHRGLLRGEDMAGWRACVEPPASIRWRDCVVHKPAAWSQGPVFLQQLALLEGCDLAAAGPVSADYLHTLIEAGKLAFADREAWYGDPAGGSDPLPVLLDPAYTARRRALLSGRALDPAPGRLAGRCGWIPETPSDVCSGPDADWMTQLQSGMPTVARAMVRSGDTCTVAVADRHGNLAAGVPSGGWLKSSPVIPGLGFPLGTRGQTMWLVDGHPNSLRPGLRPRTTLSPSVVLHEDEPWLAFGTPGGDRQDQWTLQTFLAVTEFGADLQTATEAVAFHSDHFPSSFTPRPYRPGVVVMEDAVPAATVEQLRRRGHNVDLVPAFSLGAKVCIVGVGKDWKVRAGAGPRGRTAYAAGR